MSKRRRSLMYAMLAFCITSFPAAAQVNITIEIEAAPPPARVEVVPGPRPGYVWAPGYWSWDGRRHVWVTGHWIVERPGYVWEPEHWEHRGHRYHFAPGHWVRVDRPKDWKKADKEWEKERKAREKDWKKAEKEREKEWKKAEKEREQEWKKEKDWK